MAGWTDDVIQLADALDLDRFGVTVFDDSGHFAVFDHWGAMLSAMIGTPG